MQQRPNEPLQHKHWWDYVRDLMRPAYHFKKLKEDVKASIHALKNRDLEVLRCDEPSLAKAFRGRLFASYFLLGPFAMSGPVVGQIVHNRTENAVLSLGVALAVGNIAAFSGFQIMWGITHLRFYKDEGGTFAQRFLALQRDIVPMQLEGIKLWFQSNIILMPVAFMIAGALQIWAPQAVKWVPVPFILPTMELLLVHSTLMRLMGDLFERHSHRIAARHARPG